MYFKIFRNNFFRRAGNDETHARDAISVPHTDSSHRNPVPKTTSLAAHKAGSKAFDHEEQDYNDDLKPYPTHRFTKARADPMATWKGSSPSTTVTIAMPTMRIADTTLLLSPTGATPSPSLANIATPLLDGYEPFLTTSFLDTIPSSSSVDADPSSTPTPLTTSSSSSVSSSTFTYPEPIFGTPIVQGPAPNPGNGTGNAAKQPDSQLLSSGPVLSGGATAAISVVAVMAALALGLWLYRKWSISKRRQKLADWWLPEPFLITPNSASKTPPSMEEKDSQRNIARVRPPSLPLPAVPAVLPGPDPGVNAVPIFSAFRNARAANIRMVRCIFEPRMADELKIRVGDALRVLAEYDDGWGFCENVRGERGVIPLECLEGENISSVGTEAASLLSLGQPSFAKSSARKSSLPAKRA